jgi:hypothetical protein
MSSRTPGRWRTLGKVASRCNFWIGRPPAWRIRSRPITWRLGTLHPSRMLASQDPNEGCSLMFAPRFQWWSNCSADWNSYTRIHCSGCRTPFSWLPRLPLGSVSWTPWKLLAEGKLPATKCWNLVQTKNCLFVAMLTTALLPRRTSRRTPRSPSRRTPWSSQDVPWIQTILKRPLGSACLFELLKTHFPTNDIAYLIHDAVECERIVDG